MDEDDGNGSDSDVEQFSIQCFTRQLLYDDMEESSAMQHPAKYPPVQAF